MKSVRLSGDIRRAILSSVLAGYQQKSLSKLGITEASELSDAWSKEELRVLSFLWDSLYGYRTAGISPWMLTKTSFQISVEESSIFRSRVIPGKPGKPNAVDMILSAAEYDHLFKNMFELIAVKTNYDTALNQFKSEVSNLLDSVNTTKQLVELWPTVEQYIPAHIADPDVGIKLPMLLISRLDERLGATKIDATTS